MAPPRNEAVEHWQVHCEDLRSRLSHLLHTQKWADCTFKFQISDGNAATVADGNSQDTLRAHKLILAMASPVFAAMFYSNVGLGDKDSPVIISDIEPYIFQCLIKYMYNDDDVNFTDPEMAMSLYKAANKYILVQLVKKCVTYLIEKLNPENVCQFYEFSCFFGEDKLTDNCLELFSTRTQCILKSNGFLNAHVDTVKKIVSLDTLNINSETDLYNALLDYVKDDDNDDNLATPPPCKKLRIEQITLQRKIVVADKDEQPDQQSSNEQHNSICVTLGSNTSQSTTNKSSKSARDKLKGVIEKIRFLSMTNADLIKICEKSTNILSVEEMWALLVNLPSPNSTIKMPNGFSCVRTPRAQPRNTGAATFRHTFNIQNIKTNERVYSPPFYVRDLPWKLMILRWVNLPNDCLGVYLRCEAADLPAGWSCFVKHRLILLSTKPDTNPVVHEGTNTCSRNGVMLYSKPASHGNSTTTATINFRTSTCWGILNFMKWDELIDPEKNYVKDDCITVEVHLEAAPPVRTRQ